MTTVSVFKLLYNEYMNETMDEVVDVKIPEDLIDRFQYASLNIVVPVSGCYPISWA